MRLTRTLTSDDNELIKLYRLMCFNVFAHNQDDHSKNFTYIYDEAKDRWHLSPAYDLTYSYSFGGEHATCVNGNGNPNSKDLLMVAANAGIPALQAEHMMLAIKNTVRKDLGKYLS